MVSPTVEDRNQSWESSNRVIVPPNALARERIDEMESSLHRLGRDVVLSGGAVFARDYPEVRFERRARCWRGRVLIR